MSTLLKQHLNTHKQQLRTLGLQMIHHTHAPVHKQSHRLTVTKETMQQQQRLHRQSNGNWGQAQGLSPLPPNQNPMLTHQGA
jgi:hypothetical protein